MKSDICSARRDPRGRPGKYGHRVVSQRPTEPTGGGNTHMWPHTDRSVKKT